MVRFLDASSLLGQYEQIFVDHIYDALGLTDAPVIIDCGGNIGLATIWFKQRYPRARITVFEADPAIAPVLARNVQTLGLSDVLLQCAAVSDHNGRVAFTADGADGGRVRAEPGVDIDAVRLSDWIKEPVDILKVDIEGSEFALIADLCASGRISCVKHLICEIHTGYATQKQLAELWATLTECGFRLTLKSAETAPFLPGKPEPTPFRNLSSEKSLLLLYAWQP